MKRILFTILFLLAISAPSYGADGDPLYIPGSTGITTLGTIGTGVWQGTAIGASYLGAHNTLSANHGDTASGSVVAGDLIYGNATPKWDRLGKGTDGQFLKMVSGLPAWATATPGVAGSDTQIQFNDGGSLAGSANLTWTKGSNLLYAYNATVNDVLKVNGGVKILEGDLIPTFYTTIQGPPAQLGDIRLLLPTSLPANTHTLGVWKNGLGNGEMKWMPPSASKRSVRVATTANIASLYDEMTIDGVSVVDGDRVLVKDQSGKSGNGIWICVKSDAWYRALDAYTWDELIEALVTVEEGDTNAHKTYRCNINQGGTLGATDIEWAEFSAVTPAAGADTQIQFNDGGTTFAGDDRMIWDKTNHMLTSGAEIAGYPFGSYYSAIRGISGSGQWGVLGFSRSSDIGTTGAMACLGLHGSVKNDSNNSAYGIYTEARKTAATPNGTTAGAEFAILNAVSTQVDVTPSSNPAGATYGVGITSGVTYDGVTYYDASVGLYLAPVSKSFRRGIVIIDGSMTDLGSSKWVAMEIPNSSRICWGNDDNCVMGSSSSGYINTLIANSIVTNVTASGLSITGNLTVSGLTASLPVFTDGSKALITKSASDARTALGLAIGSDIQAYNSNLTSINQALTASSSPTFAGGSMTGDVTFNNNVGVKGKNTSGTAREMISYNSSNNLSIGTSVDGYIVMGYGGTQNDPLMIRVGGADAKQVTASGNDSCGAGFKCLRVPN